MGAFDLSKTGLVVLAFTSVCLGSPICPKKTCRKSAPTQDTFKVAVFDQGANDLPPSIEDFVDFANVDPGVVRATLNKTLSGFSEQAKAAKSAGAEMIVFAEYGIIPRYADRDTIVPFLESVPHPDTDVTPCDDASGQNKTYIQYTLSCIAAHNSIYVVANMGDVDFCGTSCHSSGRIQYNVNVVYDPTGKLIARYHKQNLYYEPWFDTPTTTDLTFFDTPFGRFGTFVCFDAIFEKPAITLVEEYDIDHVAFSTAWMNSLPYYSAVSFHQSFAIANGVNFIAANLHEPANRFAGSGIYASNTTIQFRNTEESDESMLLIGELLSQPEKIKRQDVDFTPQDLQSLRQPEFQAKISGDMYNVVTLNQDSDDVMVCYDVICCHLVFSGRTVSTDLFILAAYKGPRKGAYETEVCAFMKCENETRASCGRWVKRSETHFSAFKLTGNFTTKYVYPQVSTDKMDPSAGEWTYDGKSIVSNSRTNKPFLSAIFFARPYNNSSRISANGICLYMVVMVLLILGYGQ